MTFFVASSVCFWRKDNALLLCHETPPSWENPKTCVYGLGFRRKRPNPRPSPNKFKDRLVVMNQVIDIFSGGFILEELAPKSRTNQRWFFGREWNKSYLFKCHKVEHVKFLQHLYVMICLTLCNWERMRCPVARNQFRPSLQFQIYRKSLRRKRKSLLVNTNSFKFLRTSEMKQPSDKPPQKMWSFMMSQSTDSSDRL